MSEDPEERRKREKREYQRAWAAARREEQRPPDVRCPDCGQPRRTADTLRVHRLLVHGDEP